MAKAAFKPRKISDEQVQSAESATSDIPLAGDPRIGLTDSNTNLTVAAIGVKNKPETKVGAIQFLASPGQTYIIGQTYDFPVQQIKSNPYNARVVYPSAYIDEMGVSLVENGQRTPATGFINTDGEVVLIDGETRLRGARSGGLPTLRIEIQKEPASEIELYETTRSSNVDRNNQTPLDDAIKWKALLDSGKYKNQAEIASRLKYKPDHVSRVMQLANIPMPIIYALCEQPDLLNLRMLNAIREFHENKGDEATIELIIEVAKNDIGYRRVAELAKTDNTGVQRARAERNVVSFKEAKGEVKSFEKGGRLELSIKGLSPEAMIELKEKIFNLLQKP